MWHRGPRGAQIGGDGADRASGGDSDSGAPPPRPREPNRHWARLLCPPESRRAMPAGNPSLSPGGGVRRAVWGPPAPSIIASESRLRSERGAGSGPRIAIQMDRMCGPGPAAASVGAPPAARKCVHVSGGSFFFSDRMPFDGSSLRSIKFPLTRKASDAGSDPMNRRESLALNVGRGRRA